MMSPNVKTIQPHNILDGVTGIPFRQEITEALDAGADIILVDCQDLKFMDSSGLGALVLALKATRAANRKLVLCSLNKQVKMLFQLTDISQVFLIYEDQHHFEINELLKAER